MQCELNSNKSVQDCTMIFFLYFVWKTQKSLFYKLENCKNCYTICNKFMVHNELLIFYPLGFTIFFCFFPWKHGWQRLCMCLYNDNNAIKKKYEGKRVSKSYASVVYNFPFADIIKLLQTQPSPHDYLHTQRRKNTDSLLLFRFHFIVHLCGLFAYSCLFVCTNSPN